MRLTFLAVLLGFASQGCQHIQLKNHTIRQARTQTDIQYRQVLDNIALFSTEPNALPYYLLLGTGQSNINSSVNLTGGLNWDLFSSSGVATLFFFDKANAGSTGTNSAIEQWTTAPCLSPSELEMMRCVYQRTVGCPTGDCEQKLCQFFAHHLDRVEAMQPGWFGVGRRLHVPHNACYVGHYKDTYVWVTPEGVENLTKLTIAILDIATTAEGAIPDRLNPDAARLRSLEAETTALADMLNKYPDKTSKAYLDIKGDLEKKLEEMHGLLQKPVGATGTGGKSPTFVPRKNLYNPLLAPLSSLNR